MLFACIHKTGNKIAYLKAVEWGLWLNTWYKSELFSVESFFKKDDYFFLIMDLKIDGQDGLILSSMYLQNKMFIVLTENLSGKKLKLN